MAKDGGYTVEKIALPLPDRESRTLHEAEIRAPSGIAVLFVRGTEKELVRIAAGAVVAALNKAGGY